MSISHAGGQLRGGQLHFPLQLAGAALCLGATVIAALALQRFGLSTLVMLLVGTVIAMVVIFPRRFLLLLMVAGVVLEPNAIDYTEQASNFLWRFPDDVTRALPLTLNPFEVYLLAGCLSLFLRPSTRGPRPRLPVLVWAVPVVIAVGFAYGLSKGGPGNLAYNEARGLIFGVLAFMVIRRFGPGWGQALGRAVLFAGAGLSLVVLQRYFLFTRSGDSEVPLEFAYAHENAVFFAIAFFYGTLRLLGPGTKKGKALLVAHNLLILGATLATAAARRLSSS